MIKMKKFKRKPLQVEAIQVTPTNGPEIAKLCGGTYFQERSVPIDKEAAGMLGEGDFHNTPVTMFLPEVIRIPVEGSWEPAEVSDWVVKQNGEFHVFTNEEFEASHDEVLPKQPNPKAD